MESYDIYNDIKLRTNGEIYIGVVGPVRTGKSTFIKRFMEMMVVPNIDDSNEKEMAMDEMPQSASGKMIMTTEPKFIPKNGVKINVDGEIELKLRMIDCVGYVVDGAEGQVEDGKERMVKTPWYDYDIPFAKAAEIGTKKVINNHSTVGIVVSCDGSFGELQREQYLEAEERTINELKKLGKPFVVVLNTNKPNSPETKKLVQSMCDTYQVPVLPVNCDQLSKSEINEIFKSLLYSFPITCVNFIIPKWLEVVDNTAEIKKSIIEDTLGIMQDNTYIYNIRNVNFPENEFVKNYECSNLNLADGSVNISVKIYDKYYYEMLTEMLGCDIHNEYDFMSELKTMADNKKFCSNVMNAMQSVRNGGYGLVMPDKQDIVLETPEIIKAGNKYGVKIKAEAPSVHMIKANISTEIAPIVGSKEQADDLIEYIKENTENEQKDIWDVNIFGKSVEQLVEEGLNSKANKINAEGQQKLQDAMEKIVNDGNGGLVCIII